MSNEITVIEQTAEIKKVASALKKHTNAIKRLDEATKRNVFEIMMRLNVVDTEKLAKESGEYKNTVEYAASEFGYARSTVLNYIKIASKYLCYMSDDKGKQQIATICASRDDEGKIIDYKVGQLNALTVDSETFKELHETGIISYDMSADEIRKAIKEWQEPEETEEPEEPEETKYNAIQKIISELQEIINREENEDTISKINAAIDALQAI